MKAGISRVVVEVIILVIAVALALLIFSPIGSYIFGSLGRTSAVGGSTTISVLNANIDTSGNLNLYVKNMGPNSIDGTTATNTASWQIFVDNHACTIGGTITLNDGNGNGLWDKDETLTIPTITCSGYTLSSTGSYTIVLYGPEGTQTEYLYRGG